MTSTGSVTRLLRRLPDGDRAAIQQLWEGYFRRLVGLARPLLQRQGVPRAAADEEDVALSAFDSFCRGAERGRFPRLDDRDDLWQVLVLLTRRKAANLARHERRPKRGGGKVVQTSALPAGEDGEEGRAFAGLIGREPEPQFAAQLAEECRRLLGLLGDGQLRRVALLKMEGYTNQEIADRVGRSLPTVERKLGRIRGIWEGEVGP
jgi:DNA-directed RNA polymerase specialized sigma24 family protein